MILDFFYVLLSLGEVLHANKNMFLWRSLHLLLFSEYSFMKISVHICYWKRQVKKQTLPMESPTPQKAGGLGFACMGASTWHACVDCGLCCPRLPASVLYTVWPLWVRSWTRKDDFILIMFKWLCVPGGANVPGGDCPCMCNQTGCHHTLGNVFQTRQLILKASWPDHGLVLNLCRVFCQCCRGVVT